MQTSESINFLAAFGGYGFTSRQWGLALDTIFAINAVLANGTIVRATEDSYPDLLWVTTRILLGIVSR